MRHSRQARRNSAIASSRYESGFRTADTVLIDIGTEPRRTALMQAIARVNRVFRNKPGGLVVDYIGIATDLRQALKTYVDANGKAHVVEMGKVSRLSDVPSLVPIANAIAQS